MKLYVWKDPYFTFQGGCIAYAVAASEDEARQMIKSSRGSRFTPDAEAPAGDIEGPPDRVHDLPHAEILDLLAA